MRIRALNVFMIIILSTMMITNRIVLNVQAKRNYKKTITLEIGAKHKIKGSKSYTFKSSRPKVASVSPKGIVKAKKIGKCIVKAKKGKKVAKYKIIVLELKEKTEIKREVLNEHNEDDVRKTVAPGNVVRMSGLQVIEIKKKIDNVCTIRLQRKEEGKIIPFLPSEAKYVEADIRSSDAEKLSIGDSVSIYSTLALYKYELKGDILYILNEPSVLK